MHPSKHESSGAWSARPFPLPEHKVVSVFLNAKFTGLTDFIEPPFARLVSHAEFHARLLVDDLVVAIVHAHRSVVFSLSSCSVRKAASGMFFRPTKRKARNLPKDRSTRHHAHLRANRTELVVAMMLLK